MKKKTVWAAAASILLIGSLVFVVAYWLSNEPEAPSINQELLDKEWVTAAYGKPALLLSTPRKLRPTFLEGEGPQNMTQYVRDARSYTFSQGTDLSILVNVVEYRPGINTNLQGAVEGAIYTLGQQPGVNNLTHTSEGIQIDGFKGQRIQGQYQMKEKEFAFANVLLADSSHLWQVTVIYPAEDESGAAITDRIVASVRIDPPGKY